MSARPWPLTAAQHHLLRYIAGYVEAHRGIAPSIGEAATALASNKSTIACLRDRLAERGAIPFLPNRAPPCPARARRRAALFHWSKTMIQPPEPNHWWDGPVGALRCLAILVAAMLLGLAIGALKVALDQIEPRPGLERPIAP